MPSIKEKLEKSKYLHNVWLFICVISILCAVSVIGMFKLNQIFKMRNLSQLSIEKTASLSQNSSKIGGFVASKTGKFYYFPWCGSARNIKSSNLIWFSNIAEAESFGYRPAGNCHGLK